MTLTLLTHDSFDASEKVLAAFTDETGIEVRVVPAGDAGQLVNRAILSAGNPEGDVLFGIDDNLLAGALDAGVFAPTPHRGWTRWTTPTSSIPSTG